MNMPSRLSYASHTIHQSTSLHVTVHLLMAMITKMLVTLSVCPVTNEGPFSVRLVTECLLCESGDNQMMDSGSMHYYSSSIPYVCLQPLCPPHDEC